MNGKKIARIGIIALVVIGFIVAAGCTSTDPDLDFDSDFDSDFDTNPNTWMSSSSDIETITKPDGTVIKTGSTVIKLKTSDAGNMTLNVNDESPVLGAFGDLKQGVAYEFMINGTAYRYDMDSNGDLFNKAQKWWGKLDGTDDIYVIVGNNFGDGYIVYIYSATDDTLTERTNETNPVILKRTTIIR